MCDAGRHATRSTSDETMEQDERIEPTRDTQYRFEGERLQDG